MEKNPLIKNNIEIKPMGSYFDLDSDGYVVNPASIDKIQEKWKPVLDDIIEAYKKEYQDKLKSIYLRGSVSKGTAIDNISDVDSFAFVDQKEEDIDREWAPDFRNQTKSKFPFVGGVEVNVTPISRFPDKQIMLNQAVCIYGEPVQVSKLKPGKEMMKHANNIDKHMEVFDRRITSVDKEEEKIKRVCVWLAKDLLRSAFEITMERSHRYTRDLYKCYEGFSEYYPEKEPEMREILNLALNPTGNKEKIVQIKNNFVPWLKEEAKKYT